MLKSSKFYSNFEYSSSVSLIETLSINNHYDINKICQKSVYNEILKKNYVLKKKKTNAPDIFSFYLIREHVQKL